MRPFPGEQMNILVGTGRRERQKELIWLALYRGKPSCGIVKKYIQSLSSVPGTKALKPLESLNRVSFVIQFLGFIKKYLTCQVLVSKYQEK